MAINLKVTARIVAIKSNNAKKSHEDQGADPQIY